jgi:hypothetical protein
LALAQDASVKQGINDKFLDPNLNVEEWTKGSRHAHPFHLSQCGRSMSACVKCDHKGSI